MLDRRRGCGWFRGGQQYGAAAAHRSPATAHGSLECRQEQLCALGAEHTKGRLSDRGHVAVWFGMQEVVHAAVVAGATGH